MWGYGVTWQHRGLQLSYEENIRVTEQYLL